MASRFYNFGKVTAGNLIVILTALTVLYFIYSIGSAPMTPPKPTTGVQDSAPAARESCRQFIERRGYHVQEWGEYWNWTTIDNRDGTWSVGARFVGMPPGGGSTNLYVTCVVKNAGDQWSLENLSRLQ